MATTVTFNGTSYSIPANREPRGWGTSLSAFLVDVAGASLSKAGGTFTLTADANFGTAYGLVSKYIKYSSGQLTLNTSGTITVPNATDTLVGKATTDTLTNKTLTSPTITGTGAIAGTFTGNLTGNVTGNVSGTSGSTTGNAATATALATARAINGTNFDGTAAITVTAAAGTLTGTTLNSSVVTSSLTTVGALNSGSITSGFGAIDIGADALTAGAGSFTTLASSGVATLGTSGVSGTQTIYGTSLLVSSGGVTNPYIETRYNSTAYFYTQLDHSNATGNGVDTALVCIRGNGGAEITAAKYTAAGAWTLGPASSTATNLTVNGKMAVNINSADDYSLISYGTTTNSVSRMILGGNSTTTGVHLLAVGNSTVGSINYQIGTNGTTAAIFYGSTQTGLSDGSAAAPGITFHQDLNTGIYRVATDSIGFSTAGTSVGTISSAGAWTLGADSTTPTHRLNTSNASTVGAAGGASALPATPTGYIIININGTDRKIPYYAT